MQCKDIETVLEQEGLEPLPVEAREHLAECRECRSYVADLTSLADAAHKLPSEIAPPERVWISLRAQLEAEGIIRTPADEPVVLERASWWASTRAFFGNRVLATAMVGILIAAAAVFEIRKDRVAEKNSTKQEAAREVPAPLQALPSSNHTSNQTSNQKPTAAPSASSAPAEFAGTAQALDDQEPVATGLILSSRSPIDASLRENLKKVNEFIAECEQHLKEHPQDQLTREYLSAAYQQKAELLSAMIERGRSVN
jgi:hypothetical protein